MRLSSKLFVVSCPRIPAHQAGDVGRVPPGALGSLRANRNCILCRRGGKWLSEVNDFLVYLRNKGIHLMTYDFRAAINGMYIEVDVPKVLKEFQQLSDRVESS